MMAYVDRQLLDVADEIAERHVPAGWFPGVRRLVKVIRLRTDIYNALCYATDNEPVEYPDMLARASQPQKGEKP